MGEGSEQEWRRVGVDVGRGWVCWVEEMKFMPIGGDDGLFTKTPCAGPCCYMRTTNFGAIPIGQLGSRVCRSN